MTRPSIDLGLDRDIAFVHSARTPADIIFHEELERLARLSPKLELFLLSRRLHERSESAAS
jgi:ferredoxin-NADP reductase